MSGSAFETQVGTGNSRNKRMLGPLPPACVWCEAFRNDLKLSPSTVPRKVISTEFGERSLPTAFRIHPLAERALPPNHSCRRSVAAGYSRP